MANVGLRCPPTPTSSGSAPQNWLEQARLVGKSANLGEDLLAQLAATPAAGREELLVSFLQQEVQAVLRLPSAPAPTVGFFDLGMDSLMAVELRNRLNRAFSGAYAAPNTLVCTSLHDFSVLRG